MAEKINKSLYLDGSFIKLKQLMKVSIFTKALILVLLIYVLIKWVILLAGPPLPSSLIEMYMTLAVIALLFYITLSNQRIGEFLRPVRATFEEEGRKVLRVSILILFPLLLGYFVYSKLALTIELPAELRVIHPASPQQIKFGEKTIKILGLENPLRADEQHLEKYMKEGANLYFTHCVFCHGPKLDGKGTLATGLNPSPADFTDIGTIAQLQESYLFWRISKGGPGLPKAAHTWNSAMPVWEDYLSEEEIWKVIMFLYQGAGVSPRTWE